MNGQSRKQGYCKLVCPEKQADQFFHRGHLVFTNDRRIYKDDKDKVPHEATQLLCVVEIVVR